MDFFGDFSKQDRASEVMTGADFWFVAEPIDAAIVSGQDTVLTEAEQQALLIERLRQREARLEQEAMMWAQQ
jgi:hypothetical protein